MRGGMTGMACGAPGSGSLASVQKGKKTRGRLFPEAERCLLSLLKRPFWFCSLVHEPQPATTIHVLLPFPVLLSPLVSWVSWGPARGGALPEARGCPCTMDHAGGRWGPMARRRGAERFLDFFGDCLLVFMGIRRTCGHAITPCDSLSALLTPCHAAQLITCIARGLSIQHSVTT